MRAERLAKACVRSSERNVWIVSAPEALNVDGDLHVYGQVIQKMREIAEEHGIITIPGDPSLRQCDDIGGSGFIAATEWNTRVMTQLILNAARLAMCAIPCSAFVNDWNQTITANGYTNDAKFTIYVPNASRG